MCNYMCLKVYYIINKNTYNMHTLQNLDKVVDMEQGNRFFFHIVPHVRYNVLYQVVVSQSDLQKLQIMHCILGF